MGRGWRSNPNPLATEEIGAEPRVRAGRHRGPRDRFGRVHHPARPSTGQSHIIVPAVHLTKEEIAELFRQKLGVDAPPDPHRLTQIARAVLREKFLSAEAGISGANFLVAETGTLVLVSNEDNGRMVTTLPELHIAIAGIEKIVPDWEALTVLLKLLARSATGQKLSTYTSFITGPRRARKANSARANFISSCWTMAAAVSCATRWGGRR